MSIYKACDIRGRFGTELLIQHAEKLGTAVRLLTGPGPVLVGGDGRTSTPALKSALIESLVRSGCKVIDLGIVPTPLFYFARQHLGIEIGLMVTASHNPAHDNGFKVTLGPQPVTAEEMSALSKVMEGNQAAVQGLPGECIQADLTAAYLASFDPSIPDLSGLKVVVDCSNGVGGLVARQIWQKTGADVVYLLEEVDGRFPVHTPNPSDARNLDLLQHTVLQERADLGVAYDGDADRATFMDETGQMVLGDKAIVIFARELLNCGPETIVFDQKCSRIVADTIRQYDGNPVMEWSGHTHIKRAFLAHRAAYAGEVSGHHFFRSIQRDDGLYASLFFARILKERGKRFSQLLAEIPSYPITPDIRLLMSPDEIERLFIDIESSLGGEAQITHTDGLRIEFADSWALVRPSVTEPAVTIRMEGANEGALQMILKKIEAASPLLAGQLGV